VIPAANPLVFGATLGHASMRDVHWGWQCVGQRIKSLTSGDELRMSGTRILSADFRRSWRTVS
jgi:hypothetical protein